MLKILSLFDGIGGARQALKELDINCKYYASEIDKWAIRVAKANHPDIVQLGNVKEVKPSNYNGFDFLVGGFPCQSFSIAGNRKGLGDERGQLFFEALRILNEVKPKYFLFENVASMSRENQDFISGKLGVKPIVINSSLLTAQHRKRIYWVGKLVDGQYKQLKVEQPEDRKIFLKNVIENGFTDRDKAYCIDANYYKGGNLKSYFEKGRRQLVFDKPIRLGHFNSGGQGDRIYSINGKSVCLSANGGGRGAKTGLYEINNKIRKLTVNECCRLQGFPDEYCNIISNTQAYKALGNSFTVPVIKHLLTNIF